MTLTERFVIVSASSSSLERRDEIKLDPVSRTPFIHSGFCSSSCDRAKKVETIAQTCVSDRNAVGGCERSAA